MRSQQKVASMHLLASTCICIRLYACKKSRIREGIFTKLHIEEFTKID